MTSDRSYDIMVRTIIPPIGETSTLMGPISTRLIIATNVTTDNIHSISGTIDLHGASIINTPGIIPDPDIIQYSQPISSTISNASTQIMTYGTTANTVYTAQIRVIATNLVTMKYIHYNFTDIVITNNAGVLSIEQLEMTISRNMPVTTANCVISLVGANIIVTATGEIGTTMRWKAVMNYEKVY
jgi:hypothetical protein